jgi:hypothetical protein
MTNESYEDFYARTMELYRNQSFAEALELLTREGGRFPEQAPTIYYLRSCMAARVEQPDLAIQILRDALGQGFWYGEQVMRASPSWQPLQGRPDFEELVERFKERQTAADVRPQRFIMEPAGGCRADQPCPLFVALHGNGDNGTAALNAWRPAP